MTGWITVGAILWLVVACVWVSEARKHLRIRREEREARERRDSQAGELEDAEDAVALFASLREVESSNDRSRA